MKAQSLLLDLKATQMIGRECSSFTADSTIDLMDLFHEGPIYCISPKSLLMTSYPTTGWASKEHTSTRNLHAINLVDSVELA